MDDLSVREVFRSAGWPERFVASLPDVTLGVYLRQLEQPGVMAPPPLRLPPNTLPPMTSFACPGMFDQAANARAAVDYLRERYGGVGRRGRGTAARRRRTITVGH